MANFPLFLIPQYGNNLFPCIITLSSVYVFPEYVW